MTPADYSRAHRGRLRARSSGVTAPTRITAPVQPTLCAAVDRVGQEFPALGSLVRLSWTSSA